MKEFKQLNIKPASKGFVGDKIKINKILNKGIIVHDFKVKESKFEGGGQCLHLQIEIEDEKRLVFTRGSSLIDSLKQMTREDFPFKATVVRETENGPYEFT